MFDNLVVVNLFSGPGVGKSSSMAGIFSSLKWQGVNAEQAPEFAKEKVWEGSTRMLSDNQIYVFGKQYNTLRRLVGGVDVAVTDSPLLLSLIYGDKESKEFHALVLEVHRRFRNINVLLRRHKRYNPKGRMQTEDKAKELDVKIREMLDDNGISYVEMDSGRDACEAVVEAAAGVVKDGLDVEDAMAWLEGKAPGCKPTVHS